MNLLAARKCERHPSREAVARCPSCREHFCRECVVEHEGVLLCAACLAASVPPGPEEGRRRRRGLARVALTGLAIGLLWVVFYAFGQFVKLIPARVHEGTVWQVAAHS